MMPADSKPKDQAKPSEASRKDSVAMPVEGVQDGSKFCYDDATGLTILPAEDD